MSGRAYLSVDTLSPSERLPQWHHMVSKHLGQNLDAELDHDPGRWVPEGTSPFTASLEYGALDGANLCRMVAAPHRFVRVTEPVPGVGAHPLILVMQQKAVSFFEQGGRAGKLESGDWCVLDTARPFALHNPSGCDHIVFTLPTPADASLLDLIARGGAMRCDGRGGSARLVQTLLREAFLQLDHLPVHSSKTLVDAVSGLVWNALQEFSEGTNKVSHQEAHLTRIKDYIDNHLDDPHLSPSTIAEGCKCSVRSVHRAFANEPLGSAMDYIWHRRVAECSRALKNPQNAGQSITEISMAWGFSSSSHFSRIFKKGLGVSPKHFRSQFR